MGSGTPPGVVADGSAGQPGQSTGGQDASNAAEGGGTGGATDATSPGGPDATGDDASAGNGSPGLDPVAGGTIVFSTNFAQGSMAGLERSPPNLPVDRIQIADDPINQRGKVVRIEFLAGDNFRTSAGTQPRSWLSSAPGYTVMPGKKVSVAFGFMTDNPSWGAHFAQIIRNGGPLWMMLLATDGTVAGEVHRGTGGGKAPATIQPMTWYDFRIDTDYSANGSITFFMNGQMIGQGTGLAGAAGRFDCGIYWYDGPQVTRTAWISNISIGEL
jgi:hypothetical protein